MKKLHTRLPICLKITLISTRYMHSVELKAHTFNQATIVSAIKKKPNRKINRLKLVNNIMN